MVRGVCSERAKVRIRVTEREGSSGGVGSRWVTVL